MYKVAVTVLALSAVGCVMSAAQIQTPTAEPTPAAAIPSPSALPPTRTATVPTATPADTAVVVQAIVNVRAEPDGAVIGSLAAGDEVTVIECRDSWCLIRTDVLEGYVYQGCLSLETELECLAK